MKTIKLLAVFAGVITTTINVSAQSNMPDPQKVAQLQTNRVKQNVTGITPTQESQILATELEYTKNIQNVLSTTDRNDKVTIHNKITPLREARDAKMKTILSADQDAEYEKTKPEYQGGK